MDKDFHDEDEEYEDELGGISPEDLVTDGEQPFFNSAPFFGSNTSTVYDSAEQEVIHRAVDYFDLISETPIVQPNKNTIEYTYNIIYMLYEYMSALIELLTKQIESRQDQAAIGANTLTGADIQISTLLTEITTIESVIVKIRSQLLR